MKRHHSTRLAWTGGGLLAIGVAVVVAAIWIKPGSSRPARDPSNLAVDSAIEAKRKPLESLPPPIASWRERFPWFPDAAIEPGDEYDALMEGLHGDDPFSPVDEDE